MTLAYLPSFPPFLKGNNVLRMFGVQQTQQCITEPEVGSFNCSSLQSLFSAVATGVGQLQGGYITTDGGKGGVHGRGGKTAAIHQVRRELEIKQNMLRLLILSGVLKGLLHLDTKMISLTINH